MLGSFHACATELASKIVFSAAPNSSDVGLAEVLPCRAQPTHRAKQDTFEGTLISKSGVDAGNHFRGDVESFNLISDSPAVTVHIKTMRVETLDDAAVKPWLETLDASERERAARFVFARDRILFIAAHVLSRVVLGQLLAVRPKAWCFVNGANGKPVAHLGERPAPVAFNLSHTPGVVGLAAAARADWAIGFDLEGETREFSLEIARDQFSQPELAWLGSLEEHAKSKGFLQLWTLKEAFIKATGAGLSADLKSFWFETCPPKIHFLPTASNEHAHQWWFDQRTLDGGFIAAVGLGLPREEPFELRWTTLDPDGLIAGA
jgi:4'-phosphopantetheinyl transferase